MKKKTIALAAVGSLLLLTAAAYAARGLLRPRPAPILPAMTEPGPGPRAPDNRMLGAEIGASTLEALTEWAEDRKLNCNDTSARALMKRARAKKKAEREAKIAAGEPVDAVSAASSKKKSPMARNPQVRLSCEGSQASALDGRPLDATGRALFVFDSDEHPLRHASFRRLHRTAADGEAEARATLATFVARFGAPHEVSLDLPPTGEPLKAWTPYEHSWRWADLEAKVTIVDYGRRGFSVYEVMQVPLPIRPDAPVRP